jgi:hypothetical protein
VSQATCFSPESPTDRITRLLGEALRDEFDFYPTRWPLDKREIATDCIKWLGRGEESVNCRRDSNEVKFVKLDEEQSDALYALFYSVTFDESLEDLSSTKP